MRKLNGCTTTVQDREEKNQCLQSFSKVASNFLTFCLTFVHLRDLQQQCQLFNFIRLSLESQYMYYDDVVLLTLFRCRLPAAALFDSYDCCIHIDIISPFFSTKPSWALSMRRVQSLLSCSKAMSCYAYCEKNNLMAVASDKGRYRNICAFVVTQPLLSLESYVSSRCIFQTTRMYINF